MDNLTHTLIGVTVANAGLRQKFGKGTTLALAIASNIPDIDVFGAFFNDVPSHFYRRMLTHSIFVLPVLAAVGAALFRRFRPNIPFANAWFLFALGMTLHLFFDLVNSYGVVLLYPVDLFRFELASVFIIDLAIWGLLLAPLILYRLIPRPESLRTLSVLATVGLALYVAACLSLRAYSTWAFERFQIQMALRPSFSYVFPEPLGPHRFRAVLRQDDLYRVYQFNLLNRRFIQHAEIRTQDHLPTARRIMATEMGSKMMWFFKAPVIRQIPTPPGAPERWELTDLRFSSTVLTGRKILFRYGFEVTGNDIRYVGRT